MRRSIRIAALFSYALIPLRATPTASERQPILDALSSVRQVPSGLTEFDYVMTARVRLLVFWAGKDDVGGGYIRRGISREHPSERMFQVLFGSDPAKAPRAINRWGAGTEIEWHRRNVDAASKTDDAVTSAFFGFMKNSSGKSVSEMQAELKKEKEQGEHVFKGILSRVDSGTAASLVVPLSSNTDFNLHQYAEAEPLMFGKLESSDKAIRRLDAGSGCDRSAGFLGSVADLMDAAIAGRSAPASLCYVYDAQVNTLTLEHTEAVASFEAKVNSSAGQLLWDKTYQNLMQADFVSTHKITGKKVYFSILIGTQGALRGTPVQIRYQPNWWFQVVLNLRPQELAQTTSAKF